jgi:hypothetical protein
MRGRRFGQRRIGGDGGVGKRRHGGEQSEIKNPTSGWLIGLAGFYPRPLRFSRIFNAPASWLKSAQEEF